MKLNKAFIKAALVKVADKALAKLAQKSSIAGLITFAATALGAAVDPALAGTIATVGATVASGLLVLFDEKVKPETTVADAPVAEGEAH